MTIFAAIREVVNTYGEIYHNNLNDSEGIDWIGWQVDTLVREYKGEHHHVRVADALFYRRVVTLIARNRDGK